MTDTYSATDDARDAAREWVGTTGYWWPDTTDWQSSGNALDGLRSQRIPLTHPAGRDLAVRVLAERHGTQAEYLSADVFRACDTRWDWPMDESKHQLLSRLARRLNCTTEWLLDLLLALPDVPPDLRAARALALFLETSEPPNE